MLYSRYVVIYKNEYKLKHLDNSLYFYALFSNNIYSFLNIFIICMDLRLKRSKNSI